MDDQQDQDATLSDTELPDLNDTGDGGLPDLDTGLPDLGGGELPDLGAGDLPDLGQGDGLPDLEAGGDVPESAGAELGGLDDLSPGALDLDELNNPVHAATVDTFGELPPQQTPAMAPDHQMSDSIMAFKKIQGIKVRVQVMLGETKLSVSQLANLKKGEFIQLDTKVGEPVNILANGELIARGEIAVEDEITPRFGITLTEIIDSSVLSG